MSLAHWTSFENVLNEIVGVVWGWPMIVVLVGTGFYLTLLLGLPQVRYFVHSWKVIGGKYDKAEDAGDINHFQALSSALSATIGIGNIAGVATAIHWGGPGALFWMWVTAFFGMATKFTTCMLAHKYRVIDEKGEASGGPMYAIERGLGKPWKPLAWTFAALAALTSLTTPSMVQSNTVAVTLERDFGVPPWVTGLVLMVLVGLVILGGIRRIGRVASKLVPFMAGLYIAGALFIVAKHAGAVPEALRLIVTHAFTPTAEIGGFLGSAWMVTLTWGVKRGLYSNEAGLGTAPMAHAAAKTTESVREGVVAMLGPFIDTLVLCTLTGLVIVTTGVWHEKFEDRIAGAALGQVKFYAGALEGEALRGGAPFSGTLEIVDGAAAQPVTAVFETGTIEAMRFVHVAGEEEAPFSGVLNFEGGVMDVEGHMEDLAVDGQMMLTGAELTAQGFSRGLPGRWGNLIVSIGVILFAYSTALVWSYYGDRCVAYLAGPWSVVPYRIVFLGALGAGSVLSLNVAWTIGDIAMGLLVIPNLLATIGLSRRVAAWSKEYAGRMKDERGE